MQTSEEGNRDPHKVRTFEGIYISREIMEERRERRRAERKQSSGRKGEQPSVRVIHTIHGGLASGGDTMAARRRHIRKTSVAAVQVVEPPTSRHRTSSSEIYFSKRDKEDLHFPHDDALVVQLMIANCEVRKVLIDNGSSVNIIFLSPLKKMGYKEKDIEKVTINLVGFNGETSAVVGKVVMPVEQTASRFFRR